MKLLDNEIEKALEGAISLAKMIKSKVWSIEVYKLEAALDLINRLKAENEEKSKTVVRAAQEVVDLKIKAKQQRAEIERLQKDKADIISAVEYRINQAKGFAYKEFADMLTGIFGFDELPGTVIKCHIDNLLAELTPETLNKLPHNSLCETETYKGEMK